MKNLISIFFIFVIVSCASKQTSSSDARQELDDKWMKRVGSATKSDFVEHFGNAEWCRSQATGEETCRFYKKVATKWIGESKRDKKNYDSFDEVIADFDTNGTLKSFKANAQR